MPYRGKRFSTERVSPVEGFGTVESFRSERCITACQLFGKQHMFGASAKVVKGIPGYAREAFAIVCGGFCEHGGRMLVHLACREMYCARQRGPNSLLVSQLQRRGPNELVRY